MKRGTKKDAKRSTTKARRQSARGAESEYYRDQEGERIKSRQSVRRLIDEFESVYRDNPDNLSDFVRETTKLIDRCSGIKTREAGIIDLMGQYIHQHKALAVTSEQYIKDVQTSAEKSCINKMHAVLLDRFKECLREI